jgi:hypothetical protein
VRQQLREANINQNLAEKQGEVTGKLRLQVERQEEVEPKREKRHNITKQFL